MTRCLLVLAHPLGDSLNARLASTVEALARDQGWQVTRRDLYAQGFDPRLTPAERAGYYATPAAMLAATLAEEKQELAQTQVLILVFPTWWFGFPAILKGWFDRVWTPGTAFDHSPGFGPMLPRLDALHEVLAVTTMGAPAWIDWLVLRRPLRRILALAILKPCAPKARLTWRALHSAEAVPEPRIARLEATLASDLTRLKRRLTCPD
ncbi:NAD(P)H-dependent oxidoreductase [Tabrizicola sp.]|uniref:NAD(P)H-dependent oxidoreductase n=1 Tax=Tabrizicola sp. TaxID=2005166 RepID=UPI00273244CC|nr:NAD(P)H-dependent oxidoreductase [Tabrizicola sp.]MDP3196819.1 NAD(P)H-dependent oxidoreductase [Tabrizicola sp.]